MSSKDRVDSAPAKSDLSSNPAEHRSVTITMPSNPSMEEYKRQVNPAATQKRRQSLRETKPAEGILEKAWETMTGRG